MKVSIKGFIYHKDAESFVDCFDRYAVDTHTNKFCVSDGVSKSFFPGIWAELLVETFVKTAGKVNLVDTNQLKSIQNKWLERVTEIVNRPNQKYFVRNFFVQGRAAAATFVGLHFFQDGKKYSWESIALGDSFLFFVPKNIENIDSHFDKITYVSSKEDFEFDNFPDFFDSRNSINKGRIKQVKHDLQAGTFYLMTDALSEWFISEKQNALIEIKSWKTQHEFEKRIVELRKVNLQNDDSAILVIKVEEDYFQGLNYSKINVADLSSLLIDNPQKYSSIYEQHVNIISQQFTQTSLPISEIPAETQQDEQLVQPNYVKSEKDVTQLGKRTQDYLSKGYSTKKKKRGFWEKKIDKLADWFFDKPEKESKPRIDSSNDSNSQNKKKKLKEQTKNDVEKKDLSLKDTNANGLSQDLNSISDKF